MPKLPHYLGLPLDGLASCLDARHLLNGQKYFWNACTFLLEYYE